MDLAKPGKIKDMCLPNALLTFEEYLLDYASPTTRDIGKKLIAKEISSMSSDQQIQIQNLLQKIKNNHRDVFV